ncbi:TonB-dependent receptor [Desulfospira joergensenii]|uniref:TonB-dependent receptor n=1 Tax=Desulfospira joergensenii TaxID=53329 RepID=UPI001377B40B|nr:TonB-dependent receptor [Desulfospira joergensenii]
MLPAIVCTLLLVFINGVFAKTVEEESQDETEKVLTPKQGDVFMPLGDVVVYGENEAKKLAGSVDIIGEEQIAESNAVQALDLLRKVPGVTIMNYNFAGVPNGFTLRGWYLPHGRGAAASVDGIPWNSYIVNGDGSIDLNMLMVDDIESVTVTKGPVDKRYGNYARAGSLDFQTRKRGDFFKVSAGLGSYDTYDLYSSLGKESEDGRFNQIYSVEGYTSDGYRDNSEHERKNAYGKWYYRPSEGLQLGLVVHAFDSEWDSPGYISQQTWDVNPKADNTKDDGGYKTFNEVQVHVDWQITDNMPLQFKTWVQEDDYSRFWTVPTVQSQQEYHYEQSMYGALINLAPTFNLGPVNDFHLDFGVDYKSYNTEDFRYNTSYRTRTSLKWHDEYEMQNLGTYVKADFNPLERLRLFGGLRFDTFEGTLNHYLTGTSLDMSDYDIFTYSAGGVYTLFDGYSVFADMGTSFQLPLGEAGYNTDSPEESNIDYYEAGIKLQPTDWLLLRYAYFYSTNTDEITQDATGTYSREGETLRRGHEVEIRLTPRDDIEIFASYTVHQEASYEEGTNQGNQIRFVPDYIFTSWIRYTAPTKTDFQLEYRKVGDWYLTPDNANSADGFHVANLKISQEFNKNWKVLLAVNNIFDEKYSEFALSLGGTNYYAGNASRNCTLTLKYEF